MITYSEQLKGRTALFRPAKDARAYAHDPVTDWCDPRVQEVMIVGYQEFGDFIDIVVPGCSGSVLIQSKNLLLGRKVLS